MIFVQQVKHEGLHWERMSEMKSLSHGEGQQYPLHPCPSHPC